MVPTNISYEKILERHGGGGGIPDPTHLQTMAEDLKALSRLAEARSETLSEGMRELVARRKERAEEERREAEGAARELEEKERLMKAAEEAEDIRARKGATLKKKKNERNSKLEERPLTHGAHGVARQDGLVDMPPIGTLDSIDLLRITYVLPIWPLPGKSVCGWCPLHL